MNRLKLIACDIDGVLLEDTFSPVLRNLAKKYNVDYTAELENNTFSQKRKEAAEFLRKYFKIFNKVTNEEILHEYFEERNKFLKDDRNPIIDGVPEFLNMLTTLDVKLVCYGGLDESEIDDRFKPYLKYFDCYICTNSFRPGVKEIVKKYDLQFNEVLFIDDVNRVVEEAKKYNIPFIGVPASYSWGFQSKEMEKTGVKYTVHSVSEISKNYLDQIDSDNSIWQEKN